MKKESRSIPKMCGLENEYGIVGAYINDSGKKIQITDSTEAASCFVKGIDPSWLKAPSGISWDSTARMAEPDEPEITPEGRIKKHHSYFNDWSWISSNHFLPNGARLYQDCGHPEICTPLCENAYQIVLYDKALEKIMNIIRRKYEEERGINFHLFKNNTAPFSSEFFSGRNEGVSFGTHENYLVSRRVPEEKLISQTLPFLILRIIVTGAGKVGSNRFPPADYQLSQRADFFYRRASSGTTAARGIYNERDIPYADRSRFRRLHVISGDANMCEVACFLKFSTMQVLLMMVEDGVLDNRFEIYPPIGTFLLISRDPGLEQQVTLPFHSGKKHRRALDVLKEYGDLMMRYLDDYEVDDRYLRPGVEEFIRVLGLLEKSPEETFGLVDWTTKKRLIEKKMQRNGISSWSDFRCHQIDLKYHDINPKTSVFYNPALYEKIKRLTSDEEIDKARFEPSPTRSWWMAKIVKFLQSRPGVGVDALDWQIMSLWCAKEDSQKQFVNIYFHDPTIKMDESLFSGLSPGTKGISELLNRLKSMPPETLIFVDRDVSFKETVDAEVKKHDEKKFRYGLGPKMREADCEDIDLKELSKGRGHYWLDEDD